MTDPIRCATVPLPQPSANCDPDLAECVDPSTGAPARSLAGRREACEPGTRPAAAERQAMIHRDVFERAEDSSRTCGDDRLRRILTSSRGATCTPAAQPTRSDPPRVTPESLHRQQQYATGVADRGFVATMLIGTATAHSIEHATEVAAHSSLLGAGRVLANVAPPLRLAFLVQHALEAREYLAERGEMTAEQDEAMTALRDEWSRYELDHNAASRAFVRTNASEIEQGARFVRDGRLDDPFVQQRLESSPYARLGAQYALAAASDPAPASTEWHAPLVRSEDPDWHVPMTVPGGR